MVKQCKNNSQLFGLQHRGAKALKHWYNLCFCPYRALEEYPATHGDAMGYEFVAPSGRKHLIADNHYNNITVR